MQADPIIVNYDNFQYYVLSLIWIFTLVTTTGYGDLYAESRGEYIVTIWLMFGGLFVFALISFVVNKILQRDYNFDEYLKE